MSSAVNVSGNVFGGVFVVINKEAPKRDVVKRLIIFISQRQKGEKKLGTRSHALDKGIRVVGKIHE